MPPTETSASSAFNEKMGAAHFFFQELQGIFPDNELLLPERENKLFYYTDAVIFEFYAASQQLLQFINLKARLGFEAHEVGRNTFFRQLARTQGKTFDIWDKASHTHELQLVEAYRQHVTHRGESTLLFARNGQDGPVLAVSIGVRWRIVKGKKQNIPGGFSMDLLDELRAIGNTLNQIYRDILAV